MVLQSLHFDIQYTYSRQQGDAINEPKKIAFTQIDLDKTYKSKLHRLIVVIKWYNHVPSNATEPNIFHLFSMYVFHLSISSLACIFRVLFFGFFQWFTLPTRLYFHLEAYFKFKPEAMHSFNISKFFSP